MELKNMENNNSNLKEVDVTADEYHRKTEEVPICPMSIPHQKIDWMELIYENVK